MHRLLSRQLKRYLQNVTIDEQLDAFINAVDKAYLQFDRERSLSARSLEITSAELVTRNKRLKAEIETHIELQKALGDSYAALEAIFDSTGEAILSFGLNGKLSRFNDVAEKIFTQGSKNKHLTSPFSLRSVLKNISGRNQLFSELKTLKNNPLNHIVYTLMFYSGETFELYSSPQINDGNLVGRVWCFRDITSLKKNEAKLEYQAFHDALTNLPNRTLFDDRLAHASAYAERFSSKLAILFIDLDDFKKINDNAGHHAGDTVLREVASRIKSCIREVDTLARLGGDEFVVLLENLYSSSIASTTCNRIIDQMAKPFSIDDYDYYISSSIGISVYPTDTKEPAELIRMADMAMYSAKALGKNNYQYFEASLEQLSSQKLQMENSLRDAIEQEAFHLVYQPKVSISNEKVYALEALIRWQYENGKYHSPDDFIPMAEKTGLINQIGDWVLQQTCQQLLLWREEGLGDITVSINVSPVEFRNQNLVNRFKMALSRYEIRPGQIEIEITESLFLENLEQIKMTIRELRKIGVRVSVDDFGTGYSCLKYIHELPIDVLKIDKSFVFKLARNYKDAAIVDTIITLAHNLKLSVVAEGVEDEEALLFLKQRGCDFAQGYYFYRPLGLVEVTQLLHQQSV